MNTVLNWFKRKNNKSQLRDWQIERAAAEPALESITELQEDSNFVCGPDHYPVKIGAKCRNRYTVVRKLGMGYSSSVWLCKDRISTKLVALKIVKSGPRFTKQAMNEIRLLKCAGQYDDPHKCRVIQLLDYFKIPNANNTHHVCMVFEALGDNLITLMQRFGKKGLPLASVKSIIRQVLEALDYLHTTCNVIHTDIKPDNVCVNYSKGGTTDMVYTVTVADLGNACWVNRKFTKNIQTWPYRCPEVILGADYNANADIWSTACLAFDLATGTILFPAEAVTVCKNSSRNENHLALIVELLGDVPKEMAFSEIFFTAKGKLIRFPKLKQYGLLRLLTEVYKWEKNEACQFVDFLLPMLNIDPNKRSAAKVCLSHKWLQF